MAQSLAILIQPISQRLFPQPKRNEHHGLFREDIRGSPKGHSYPLPRNPTEKVAFLKLPPRKGQVRPQVVHTSTSILSSHVNRRLTLPWLLPHASLPPCQLSTTFTEEWGSSPPRRPEQAFITRDSFLDLLTHDGYSFPQFILREQHRACYRVGSQ